MNHAVGIPGTVNRRTQPVLQGTATRRGLSPVIFDAFFVGFFPDAGLANVVEFEHAAKLLSVFTGITADQHLIHQV